MLLATYIKIQRPVQRTRPSRPLAEKTHAVYEKLNGKQSFNDIAIGQRRAVRTDLYVTSTALAKLAKTGKFTDPKEKASAQDYGAQADKLTKYIPLWVKVAVACALGFGTMVGWKRIVVTVGEKIGKSHLTYGQGRRRSWWRCSRSWVRTVSGCR